MIGRKFTVPTLVKQNDGKWKQEMVTHTVVKVDNSNYNGTCITRGSKGGYYDFPMYELEKWLNWAKDKR